MANLRLAGGLGRVRAGSDIFLVRHIRFGDLDIGSLLAGGSGHCAFTDQGALIYRLKCVAKDVETNVRTSQGLGLSWYGEQ